MRLYFTLLFSLASLSFYYSQQTPPCSTVSGCNSGNNFQWAAQEFYVNTDSVISITDTSAILKGYGTTMDANCNYGGFQFKITAIAMITKDCNVACNSNLDAGKVFTQVYDNTTCWAWTNGQSTSIQMNGLRPNTTYYVRFLLHRQFYSNPPNNFNYVTHQVDQYFIGNILKFKTAKGYAELNNNYISVENPVYCVNQNPNEKAATYIAKGSDPAGAIGNYAYNWQMSSDGGVTWLAATGDNNNPTNTKDLNLAFGFFQFNWKRQLRRIVSSGYHSDTSNVVNIRYYASPPNAFVNIVQQSQLSKDVLLVPEVSNYSGSYKVQWLDSINEQPSQPIASLANGSLLLPVTTQTVHNYRAIVNIGHGCPTFVSPVIGISNPDGSGNIYPTIFIGTQNWFISNLRTEKLTNGTAINLVKDNSQWNSTNSSAFSWHNNDKQNSVPYGALYNGYVVLNNSAKVCPAGWRVPTWHEWKTLVTFIGGQDGSSAGNLLKTNSVWLPPNNGSNTVNFDAFPVGKRNGNGSFMGKYNDGYWWFFNSKNKWGYVQLNNSSPTLFDNTSNGANPDAQLLNSGYSIRCIK